MEWVLKILLVVFDSDIFVIFFNISFLSFIKIVIGINVDLLV